MFSTYFLFSESAKESLAKHEAMAAVKKAMTYAEYVVYWQSNPGPKSMKSFQWSVELGYVGDPVVGTVVVGTVVVGTVVVGTVVVVGDGGIYC